MEGAVCGVCVSLTRECKLMLQQVPIRCMSVPISFFFFIFYFYFIVYSNDEWLALMMMMMIMMMMC
jgi:hypothetical protein